MNKKPVIIYGAGKGGATVFETIESGNDYKVVAFFDDNLIGSFMGCPVYTPDQQQLLIEKGIDNIFIAIASGKKRVKSGFSFEKNGFKVINALHSKAYISSTVKLGKGNHIKAGAIIDTKSILGNYNIIDNGAIIAHDNQIGNGCHLSPGCSIGSSIMIGDYSILGVGAIISTKISIGKGCIISSNSSVVNDLSDNSLVEGVPGKIIGKTKL